MFLRLVGSSFLRHRRRRAVVLAAIVLGTSAAAALADIALDVGDRMRRELNAFGANLVVLPKGGAAPVVVGGEDVTALRAPAWLDAADLASVRDNFWKNNILAFAPVLDLPARIVAGGKTSGTGGAAGEGGAVLVRGTWFEHRDAPVGDAGAQAGGEPSFVSGVRALYPSWSVAGEWPRESADEALAGAGLAARRGLRAGDDVEVSLSGRAPARLRITGVLSAGGEEDDALLMPLETAWKASGLEGRVSRVLVRALTTPESAVYERLGTTPKDLPPAEFERWTCTPFPSSIAYELSRAVPGAEARVIRRVADSEGTILRRTTGLMTVIALLAAIGSALAVTSSLSTNVLERRSEIGLLKAMGAGNHRVVALFLSEAALLGTAGGLLGALGGVLLARYISTEVFGAPVAIHPLAVPIAVVVALVITVGGSLWPVRRILGFRPAEVLRGL